MQSEIEADASVNTTRDDLSIDRVYLPDITPGDLRHLAKLDKVGHDHRTAASYVQAVAEGRMSLWRLGKYGVLLTSLGGNVLWIEGVAGSALIWKGEHFLKAIRRIADLSGASTMKFACGDEVLLRYYRRLGFRPVATIMEL